MRQGPARSQLLVVIQSIVWGLRGVYGSVSSPIEVPGGVSAPQVKGRPGRQGTSADPSLSTGYDPVIWHRVARQDAIRAVPSSREAKAPAVNVCVELGIAGRVATGVGDYAGDGRGVSDYLDEIVATKRDDFTDPPARDPSDEDGQPSPRGS